MIDRGRSGRGAQFLCIRGSIDAHLANSRKINDRPRKKHFAPLTTTYTGGFDRSTWSYVMGPSWAASVDGAAAEMRQHESAIKCDRSTLFGVTGGYYRRLAAEQRTREPGARLSIRTS